MKLGNNHFLSCESRQAGFVLKERSTGAPGWLAGFCPDTHAIGPDLECSDSNANRTPGCLWTLPFPGVPGPARDFVEKPVATLHDVTRSGV
jgi:hypothetical protein